jgi:catechol 2,3-dioxygenase-like lactoylglutathione lyase family enzyme
MQVEFRPHGTRFAGDEAVGERPPAQEEGAGAQARGRRQGLRTAETGAEVVSHVAAVHLYVTDLDRSVDFYSRLLGHGPQAAYDEGENAHSAFFVLEEGGAFLVLTWDPERGRQVGGGSRLELAVEDVESEVDRLRARGIDQGRQTRTRFGTDVFDVSDPDGYLVRVGPAWTLHAIEGAV